MTPSLLSDFYPAERRGRALATFYAAIPLGSALGFGLGGVLGKHIGWRAAFFVAGGPGAVLAMALLFLRDPPRGAFDARPRDFHRAARSRSASRAALAPAAATFTTPSRQTIYTFAMGGLAVWMPTYFVRERHLPLATTGVPFGGVLCLAGFLGTLVGGQLGDRMAARRARGISSCRGGR